MSSTIDITPTIPDTLSNDVSKQQQPLTVREKIVNLFQELEITRDDKRRVNTELDKEIQSRIEAEAEAAHLRRQVQLVEVNLDNATARVNHVTTQLIEVIKVSEAARHVCTNLENKLTAVKDKEIDLDDELRKAKECSIETDKRFQETANKLTDLQERFDLAERRSTIAEQRIASLEQDIRHAYVEMKTLLQAEEKGQATEEKYRKTIDDLQSRLKSAQQRTDEADVEVGKLQLKVDKLKEKLADERNKCHQLQKMVAASSAS
jgi:chromosome segregation ATPase